jgi:PKD repeat protein
MEETPMARPRNGDGPDGNNGKPVRPPHAVIELSPSTGPAPLTISFNASRSRPGTPDAPLDYSWNFGDNTSIVGDVRGQHTYSFSGSYIVALTVDDGFRDNTAKATVTVTRPLPVADFSTDTTSDFVPLVVRFDASKSSIAAHNAFIKNYVWDFGDGNIGSGPVVFHRYDIPGIYSVSLTVTDDVNASSFLRKDNYISAIKRRDPIASIDANPLTGIAPLAVSVTIGAESPDDSISNYMLDFGDGNTVTNVLSTTHTYVQPGIYIAKLTVIGAHGTKGFADSPIQVTVNQPPVAFFKTDPAGPLSIQFDASRSSDPDDAIVKYEWDFGDTIAASGPDSVIIHSYRSAGTYAVRLIVTDNGGNKSDPPFTKQVVVTPPGPPPIAKFSATPSSGTPPLSVVFNASFSDGIIPDSGYTWDFGDTTLGSGSNPPPKTYDNTGIYPVQLAVKDVANATSFSCLTISVTDGPIPVTTFTLNPEATPLMVSFDASAFTMPDDTISHYAWDFGDGLQDTGVKVTHLYKNGGHYSVVLIVTGSKGVKACASNIITVQS